MLERAWPTSSLLTSLTRLSARLQISAICSEKLYVLTAHGCLRHSKRMLGTGLDVAASPISLLCSGVRQIPPSYIQEHLKIIKNLQPPHLGSIPHLPPQKHCHILNSLPLISSFGCFPTGAPVVRAPVPLLLVLPPPPVWRLPRPLLGPPNQQTKGTWCHCRSQNQQKKSMPPSTAQSVLAGWSHMVWCSGMR